MVNINDLDNYMEVILGYQIKGIFLAPPRKKLVYNGFFKVFFLLIINDIFSIFILYRMKDFIFLFN